MGWFRRKSKANKAVDVVYGPTTQLMPMSNFTFIENSITNYLNAAYAKNPHVYSIVQYIGKNTSTMPYVDLPDYISIYLLNDIYISLEITGNAFLIAEDAVGFKGPQKLTLLNADAIEIITNNNGEKVGYVYTNAVGNQIPYTKDEIIHIKFSNLVDKDVAQEWGMSPLRAGVSTYQTSNNIHQAQASIFENYGATGILTNDTDIPIPENEREGKDNTFKLKAAGVKHFGKTLTSNLKLRYIQIGMSPTALKIVENNINNLRTLCSLFGISSLLFNDHVASTRDNLMIADKSFYTNVAIPLAQFVLQELNRELQLNMSINVKEIEQLKPKDDGQEN